MSQPTAQKLSASHLEEKTIVPEIDSSSSRNDEENPANHDADWTPEEEKALVYVYLVNTARLSGLM